MSTTYRYYIAVNENYSREHPFVVIRRELYESGGGIRPWLWALRRVATYGPVGRVRPR